MFCTNTSFIDICNITIYNDNQNDNPQATAHCEKLFRLIDIDGDGNLTEAEFLRVELDFIIIYNHLFFIIYHISLVTQIILKYIREPVKNVLADFVR